MKKKLFLALCFLPLSVSPSMSASGSFEGEKEDTPDAGFVSQARGLLTSEGTLPPSFSSLEPTIARAQGYGDIVYAQSPSLPVDGETLRRVRERSEPFRART